MTRQSSVAVRMAQSTDVDGVAMLIAEAFYELAASIWLIPAPDRRLKVLAADFRITVEHAQSYGDVYVVDDSDGAPVAAGVWFRHESEADPVPPAVDYDRRLAAAVGQYVDRFGVLDSLFADHHLQSYPHHYLALMAARPDRQSRGLGSLLLVGHQCRARRPGDARLPRGELHTRTPLLRATRLLRKPAKGGTSRSR